MTRRLAGLVLAVAASLATSQTDRTDFRTPCADGNVVVQGWDPNRPLFMGWWGNDPIPTSANFTNAVILQPVGGEPIEYWAEAPSGGSVIVCPKNGLEPDTEYEWRVRRFINDDPNHLPVPFYSQGGIVRFRTASTSDLPAIGSAGECRRFRDWDFNALPACTDGWFDNDFDGWPVSEGDCNDSDGTIHPGAEERCDGIDNDCNGSVDENFALRLWPDTDGDGFGDADNPVDLIECTTERPPDLVANGRDCNDADPAIHPGVPDIPGNGVDEDCDGLDADDTAAPDDTGAPTDTGAQDTGWDTADTATPTGDTG